MSHPLEKGKKEEGKSGQQPALSACLQRMPAKCRYYAACMYTVDSSLYAVQGGKMLAKSANLAY